MSNIGGVKRQEPVFDNSTDFVKKVGLFEANVIAVNPNTEEFKDILNMELKEDSKQTEYLGTSKEGNNTTLRVDFWLEEVKKKDKFKVTFFLENKEKENKDKTKKQYINSIGSCSWAADANDLPEWFSKREYRVAFVGEEELYNFLRSWLGNLDYREAETTLQLEWKKLMVGNVKDLKSQVGGEWVTPVVALATIKTVEKEDGVKEYQGVYNKAFLPGYCLKAFRLLDYSKQDVLTGLRSKKSKDLKPHERFALNVAGEYGCRDYYTLRDLKDYSADDNLVASDKAISEDDADY
jgi:hypothetical protein|tara:strand:+ start:930 stop:1811 length:882 start_codon:yes stop_codon:yes gene_type:complete